MSDCCVHIETVFWKSLLYIYRITSSVDKDWWFRYPNEISANMANQVTVKSWLRLLQLDNSAVLIMADLAGGSSGSSSPLAWVPVSSSRGRLSHIEPNSDMSEASLARDDLRDDALDPRCTCRNADSFPCQPPGLELCVFSSSASACSCSFFRLQSCKFQ